MRIQKTRLARLSILTCLLVLTAGLPLPAQAQRLGQSRTGGPVTVKNDYIEVRANDWGQYTIGTLGGDPATADDDGRRLTYGHGGLGFTSFTTLRVVSGGQTDDFPLLQNSEPPPHEQNGALTANWLMDGVAIAQTLAPATNPYTNRADTIRIALTATNTSGQAVSAGLRIMLDTMIGDNDQAPFFVPGTGNFNNEREFSRDQMPAYWKAFEATDYSPASLKGQGIITGLDATAPDRLVFAAWPSIKNTAWDYRVAPNLSVGDSAVALYWEPKDLAPGASITWVTYYGLAGAGGGNAWIDAPVNITSAEPEFNATLWVANLSDADFTGGEARIVLPQGLRLAPGETERKPMATVPVSGGAQSVTWRLVGDGTVDATYPYSATATFQTGSRPLSANAQVAYRFIAPLPAATVTARPSPTATSTNTPNPPVAAPIAPAPTQSDRPFPWWLLLIPLVLLPLLFLLVRRRPAPPPTRVAPRALRAPLRRQISPSGRASQARLAPM